MNRSILLIAALLLTACREYPKPSRAPRIERIGLSSDGRSFVLLPSGQPFHPWGNNYGNHGRLIEDYWASDWPLVEQDFREMKRMGATVVRVHLQFGKFMLSPTTPNSESLARLSRLLRFAEITGLYLDITGLGCYRTADVPSWYDQLSEPDRWQAQARFWSAIAATCADSSAIFCYDLINEPVVTGGKQKPGAWYSGEFGDYKFIQFIALDSAGRSSESIALQWGDAMIQAIHERDHRHFVTAGLLPFFPGTNILARFDFVSVHIYPESGKINDALDTLKQFDIGKPVVIEETFPLACSADDLKKFILDSRAHACGWIGHYNGEPIAELESLQKTGTITLQQSIWLAWLRLFRDLGPIMSPTTP